MSKDSSIGKCVSCGLPTFGISLGFGEDIAFIPSLCELCLVELSQEMMDEADPDGHLTCPKCTKKVSILRRKECIECYETRCESTLKLPMDVETKEPPLGWNDIGQRFRIELDYEIVQKTQKEC